MAARTSVILLLVVFLMGCRPATPPPAAAPVMDETPLPESAFVTPGVSTQAPAMPGISAEDVKNATYELGMPNIPQSVELVNGVHTGTLGQADSVLVEVTDFIALGDIDVDGVNEAAAIVSETYGGSGVFVFLAVFSYENAAAVFRTSVFLDDRAIIDGIAIENNEVWLDVTVHGMDEQGVVEPSCCPTLRTTRHYRLVNNQLDMSDYTTFTPAGAPRTITIESPAHGMEVFSSVQVRGSVSVAPFENNLTYSIKDVGGVELSRGAIDVTAAEPGGPATFDAIIPLGNILTNAVVIIEVQDTSAANGSLLAMDSVELVVK